MTYVKSALILRSYSSNYAVSSGYIAPDGGNVIINCEQVRVWNQVDVTSLKVPPHHSVGETKENYEHPRIAGSLTATVTCSVQYSNHMPIL
jgi:hypothetical protein